MPPPRAPPDTNTPELFPRLERPKPQRRPWRGGRWWATRDIKRAKSAKSAKSTHRTRGRRETAQRRSRPYILPVARHTIGVRWVKARGGLKEPTPTSAPTAARPRHRRWRWAGTMQLGGALSALYGRRRTRRSSGAPKSGGLLQAVLVGVTCTPRRGRKASAIFFSERQIDI